MTTMTYPSPSYGGAAMTTSSPADKKSARHATTKCWSASKTGVFAVTDGHGAHGDELAQVLVKRIVEEIHGDDVSTIKEACEKLDSSFRVEGSAKNFPLITAWWNQRDNSALAGEQRYRTSGASTCVVRVTPTSMTIVNVGDCQAMVFGNTKAKESVIYSSTQHTCKNNPVETEHVLKCGGWLDDNGCVNGQLLPSRCFGHFSLKGMAQVITCTPDVTILPRTCMDEFLLVVSAAVGDVMSHQDLYDTVVSTGGISRTNEDIAAAIVEEAIRRGSKGTCTAVFVRLADEVGDDDASDASSTQSL